MNTPEQEPIARHIRRRPGMYFGGLCERGLRCIVDQLVEEQISAVGAAVSRVVVGLAPDGWLRIEFVGVLADVRPEDFVNEFRAPGECNPWLSLLIAAAASERLDAEMVRAGSRWSQSFVGGVPLERPVWEHVNEPDRLVVRYRPDRSLFGDLAVPYLALCGRIQELAIFRRGVVLRVETADGGGMGRDYCYPRGLLDYLLELEHDRLDVDGPMPCWHLKLADGPDRAEAVILRRWYGPYLVQSFVNAVRSIEGGSHVEAFEQSFVKAFIDVGAPYPIEPYNVLRAEGPALEKMTVLLAVELQEPEWAESVRHKLASEKGAALVGRMVREQMPGLLKEYFDRCVERRR